MWQNLVGTVVGGWLGVAQTDGYVASMDGPTGGAVAGVPPVDVETADIRGGGAVFDADLSRFVADDGDGREVDAAVITKQGIPIDGPGEPAMPVQAGVGLFAAMAELFGRLLGGGLGWTRQPALTGPLVRPESPTFLAPAARRERVPLLDLDEPFYHDLCDIALLDPERMPSLVEFSSRLAPEQRDVLRRYRDAFFELTPVPEDLENAAFRIFYNALPRSETGGLDACYYPWEERLYELAVTLNHQPTAAESAWALALGLPLFTGGRLSFQGTRRMLGWLDSKFTGYHTYTAEDGRRFYSLQPLDEATPEEIVELYRFIKESTLAQGIMAEPMGIHFYRGRPRILFEKLVGRRMFCITNKDANLPPDFESHFDTVMSPRLLSHKRIYGRFGDDAVLEEDYMFISNGKFRIGLQVRVREFIESVNRGAVFCLAR